MPFNPMITTLAQKAPIAAHCGRTRAAGTTKYTVSSSAQSTPTFHTVPSSATIQPMPGVVPAPCSTAESSGIAAMSSGLAVSTNQYSTNRRIQVRPCRARKTRLKLNSMLVISQMALRTVTLTPTQPSALRSISEAWVTRVSTQVPSATAPLGAAVPSVGGTMRMLSKPSELMKPATNGANCAPINVLATNVTTIRIGISPKSVLYANAEAMAGKSSAMERRYKRCATRASRVTIVTALPSDIRVPRCVALACALVIARSVRTALLRVQRVMNTPH